MTEKPTYEELEHRIEQVLRETAHRDATEGELRQAKGELERQLEEARTELRAIRTSLQLESSRRQSAEQEIFRYRRAAEELDTEGRVLRTVLRSIEDGVITTDREGKVLSLNKTAEHLTGWRQKEAHGKPLGEVFCVLNEETRKRCKDPTEKALKTGKAVRPPNNAVLVSRDGTERMISDSAVPFRNRQDSIAGMVLVFRDITEKARIATHFLHSQKREAIGTLASGIAHDFNNILAAAIGYTELALHDAQKDTLLRSNLEQVLSAGLRGRDLAKRVLAFSRESEQEKKLLQLSTTIREAMALVRGVLPSTVDIRLDIEVESEVTLADPAQIHQVLMNLCTNAAHAMDYHGELTVSLTRIHLDSESVVTYPELSPGTYLKLTVRDTGHGMGKEVLDRIFDPFFTTKGPGEGSGMGLAVVQGIVGSHDGAITVASELGKGTTFDVLLPRSEREVVYKQESVETTRTGAGHVLFVDDEPAIVKLSERLLERLNYKVTGRTSSIEALEAFRAQPHKFDVVVTDMTMPNMTGLALSKELFRIREDIPIILCTGFSEAIDPENARKVGIREMLMKPVLARDLNAAILKVLGKEEENQA